MADRAGWERIHPAIRITLLLVTISSAALGTHGQLAFVWGLLLLLYSLLGSSALYRLWQMFRRLRWFWVSIVLFFFWFTPGDPVKIIGLPEVLLPTTDGLVLGAWRLGALAAIVAGVAALSYTTDHEQLLRGLLCLLAPLRAVGVSTERFAVRMGLVFSRLTRVAGLAEEEKARIGGQVSSRWETVQRLRRGMLNLFSAVRREAEQEPLEDVTLAQLDEPPLHQWLLVIAVAALLLGVGSVV